MAKIKTVCELDRYDDDRDGLKEKKKVIVRSHWNWGDRVVIEIDGKCATVLSEHLRDAVANCSER